MKKVKQSFTLIEILVVIVIIGILSSFIFFTINDSVEKAQIAKSKMFSESIRNNLLLNLVSEWKLDNGSGTIALDSWGNNSGTLISFTDTSAGYGDTHDSGWKNSSECISKTCLKFNGNNGYISTNHKFNTPNYITTNFWINCSFETFYRWILDGGQHITNGSYGIVSPQSSNSIQYRYSNGTTSAASAVATNILQNYFNTWVNITIVTDYINNTVDFYRNGVKFGNTQSMTTPIKPTTTFTNIGSYNSTSYKYKGSIDEVQIYDAAISGAQIKQNYLAGLNNLYAKGLISETEYNNNLSKK